MKSINLGKIKVDKQNSAKVCKAAVGLAVIFAVGFSFRKLLEIISPGARAERSAAITSEAFHSAFIDGECAKAIDELTDAIRLDTANVIAYVIRGRVYLLLKDYVNALNDLNKAFARGESNSEVYLYRAQVYYAMEDYAGAFADYSKSIEYMPNTEAYRGKGEVYLRMNNPEEAVVCYTKAIELSPDSHETYFARGNAYNKQAMYSMAASDFERAMKLNPVNETYKRNRDFALELMKSEK